MSKDNNTTPYKESNVKQEKEKVILKAMEKGYIQDRGWHSRAIERNGFSMRLSSAPNHSTRMIPNANREGQYPVHNPVQSDL